MDKQELIALAEHECGWCGLAYQEGQHFYDDTCNTCARKHGLEVPRDWRPRAIASQEGE